MKDKMLYGFIGIGECNCTLEFNMEEIKGKPTKCKKIGKGLYKWIEAIQKLLSAHSEAGGTIPSSNVCWNAFISIEEQTGISKYTEEDKKIIRNNLNMTIVLENEK